MSTEFNRGVEAAAALLDKMCTEYTKEFGSYDPETGVTELAGHREEYANWLTEAAEDIRNIKVKNVA